MPDTIGGTLKEKAGPLPIWSWTVIGIVVVAGFLYYRQKKAAATAAQTAANTPQDSSNLGTVPISNLTTAAQPMPIQMGDTFVDVQPVTQTQTVGNEPPFQPPIHYPPPQPPIHYPVPGPPYPGQVMQPSPTPPKPSPAPTPAPAPTPPPPAPVRTITVCPWPAWCGSLWGIAAHYYGNGADWPKIYEANQAKIGSNPNLIHVGTVLVIP